jgi:hypothetical protein
MSAEAKKNSIAFKIHTWILPIPFMTPIIPVVMTAEHSHEALCLQ